MATNFENKGEKSAEAAYAAASANVPAEKPATEAVAKVAPVATAKVEAPKAAPAAAPVADKAAPVAKTAKVAEVKKAAPAKAAAKKVTAKAAPKKAATKATPKIVKAAPAKSTETAQEGIKKMANNVKNFAEEAQAKAGEFFGDYSTKAKAAAEKGQEFAKEVVEFTKGNVEAVVESGKIGLKGSQDLTRDYVEFAKKGFEESTAAMKKVAAVKTPTEFFQIQGELSRGAFDAVVKQTSKNSEAVLKLANDMFQPISNRVSVAVSKIKSAA